ncbi:MAG: hypothetical protein LQ345_002392 [Seirophora villosa]|nr:MAG: hypothetical protein LQ345_002392 [Seirophora villosa]
MKFSWNTTSSQKPRVVLTAEDADFDATTLQRWRDEGFDVSYLPFTAARKAYVQQLHHLADPLELGEKYAIVAFGEAAEVVLETALKPIPKLCALVAYYPDRLPSPGAGYPPSLRVTVHLAGSQPRAPKFHSHSYPEAEPGFAEHDLDQFDKVSAGLAWTRSLELVRKGFEVELDLEGIWEDHSQREFVTRDADATMETMTKEPYVNHVPTMTGGIGYRDLLRFYRDYFIPGNPPSLKMKLISRTIGTDRVVDEMVMGFRHTQEIAWLLPGVAPTQKHVEFALVAIVCIRGGKLYHEHIYWDQATVLVQTGLLDPNLSGKGFKRLPVVDGAGARKVLDEESEPSNELIPGWGTVVSKPA